MIHRSGIGILQEFIIPESGRIAKIYKYKKKGLILFEKKTIMCYIRFDIWVPRQNEEKMEKARIIVNLESAQRRQQNRDNSKIKNTAKEKKRTIFHIIKEEFLDVMKVDKFYYTFSKSAILSTVDFY